MILHVDLLPVNNAGRVSNLSIASLCFLVKPLLPTLPGPSPPHLSSDLLYLLGKDYANWSIVLSRELTKFRRLVRSCHPGDKELHTMAVAVALTCQLSTQV